MIIQNDNKPRIVRTYYELQPRDHSADVILYVRVTERVEAGKAKQHLHKEVVVIPTQKKKEGDKIAKAILQMLNDNDTNNEF